MANKTISELSVQGSPIPGDIVPIVSIVDTQTKKITLQGIFDAVVASVSTFGSVKTTTATSTVISDDDTRVPTQDENDAMAGTYGTPGLANRYVTETDTNLTNNVKLTGDESVAGVKTFTSIPVLPDSDPTTSNQLVRKSYADGLTSVTTGTLTDGTATIYYTKKGKLYFNISVVDTVRIQANGYACLLYPDANTYNRICALLGKTYSTSTNFIFYGSSSGSTLGGQWNGSTWVATSLGASSSETCLSTITTTD